jgi:VanZ family protein
LATVTVALLLFAAATEILQFVTATRTSTLSDWAINAGGILAGATIALVGHRAFPDTVAPRRTA